MKVFHLRLSIPPEEMMHYYRGDASAVVATAGDGTRIQMPARLLRPYVGPTGVRGRFILRCDDAYRLISLDRVGD